MLGDTYLVNTYVLKIIFENLKYARLRNAYTVDYVVNTRAFEGLVVWYTALLREKKMVKKHIEL